MHFSSKFPGHITPVRKNKWTTKHAHDNCYRALTGGRTAPRGERKKTRKNQKLKSYKNSKIPINKRTIESKCKTKY